MMNYVNDLTTPGNQEEIVSVETIAPEPAHATDQGIEPVMEMTEDMHHANGDPVDGDGSKLWWSRYSKVGTWSIHEVLSNPVEGQWIYDAAPFSANIGVFMAIS